MTVIKKNLSEKGRNGRKSRVYKSVMTGVQHGKFENLSSGSGGRVVGGGVTNEVVEVANTLPISEMVEKVLISGCWG